MSISLKWQLSTDYVERHSPIFRGVLNFNNMIPVSKNVIKVLPLKILSTDCPENIHYKKLAQNQLSFCRHHCDAISKKANKLYRMITENKANHLLRKRCCNYEKLERILEKYSSK